MCELKILRINKTRTVDALEHVEKEETTRLYLVANV